MKHNIATTVSAVAIALFLQSAVIGEKAITKENGVYIVNTTTIAKDVKGYAGTTPLKIYIQKNKILKIESLKNQETPKYFAKVKKQLLNKWDGKTVNEAMKMKVDGVTGATYSSEAVIKNVQMGLKYYKRNK